MPKETWKLTVRAMARFTLRGFLVGVSLCCLAFWWIGYQRRSYLRQDRARVKLLEDKFQFVWLRGNLIGTGEKNVGRYTAIDVEPKTCWYLAPFVSAKYLYDVGEVAILDLGDDPSLGITQRDDLPLLRDFRSIRVLSLWGRGIDDADIAHVRHCGSTLEAVVLTETSITDVGLREVGQFSAVTKLFIGYSPIGDDGVKHLRGLSKLKKLQLRGTKVGDHGVAYLVGLPYLEYLDLAETQVSDECIESIARMAKLEAVDLTETNVTESGLARLQQVAPWITPYER